MNRRRGELQGNASLGPVSYDSKEMRYFSGVRHDYLAELPTNPNARILEVGCGTGDMGVQAISEGKCGTYHGIEICSKAAAKAREQITEVIVADVEELDPPWPDSFFDALILSEVLEHLFDPWNTLKKLRPLMKAGALVFSSSPNAAHYAVISMLLRGELAYTEKGIMDRTHIRWFTPKAYRRMFEHSGFHVTSVRSVSKLGVKALVAKTLLCGLADHLFWRQINLSATCQ